MMSGMSNVGTGGRRRIPLHVRLDCPIQQLSLQVATSLLQRGPREATPCANPVYGIIELVGGTQGCLHLKVRSMEQKQTLGVAT